MNKETVNEDRHHTQMQHNLSYRAYRQQYEVRTSRCSKKKKPPRSGVERGKQLYRLTHRLMVQITIFGARGNSTVGIRNYNLRKIQLRKIGKIRLKAAFHLFLSLHHSNNPIRNISTFFIFPSSTQ